MVYRAVFHLDAHDDKIFALSLTNVSNLLKAVTDSHYDVVMLFNGPAVQLLHQEGCTLQEEVHTLQQQRVSFKVCRNALEKFGMSDTDLLAGCSIVPAGIVELIVLQQDGYAYIKP